MSTPLYTLSVCVSVCDVIGRDQAIHVTHSICDVIKCSIIRLLSMSASISRCRCHVVYPRRRRRRRHRAGRGILHDHSPLYHTHTASIPGCYRHILTILRISHSISTIGTTSSRHGEAQSIRVRHLCHLINV